MPKWMKILIAVLPAILDLMQQIEDTFFPEKPTEPEVKPATKMQDLIDRKATMVKSEFPSSSDTAMYPDLNGDPPPVASISKE